MKFPLIESKNILLRELIEQDSHSLYPIFSNKEAMKYWGSLVHENIEFTKKTLNKLIYSWSNRDGVSWGIVHKKTNKLIGQISLHSWDSIKETVKFGYIINPSFWGNGFGKEVLNMVIDFSFRSFQVKTLIAEVNPGNTKSISILKSCEFELVEQIQNDLKVGDKYFDTNVYRLSKGEKCVRPGNR